MEQKIKEVMAKIFNLAVEEIDQNTSPETITIWDSLKHMSLILSLEEEFNVQFEDEELIEMMDFKSIYTIIINKK